MDRRYYSCGRPGLSVNRPHGWRLGLALAALAVAAAAGCSSTEEKADPAPPVPTYTGPAFLRGTIASRAQIKGYEPVLVEGFGLVSDLDGTGAAEPPTYLRTWLFNQMSRGGFGSYNAGTETMTPAVALASKHYAMVKVQGLIPPGATAKTRFDVLVTALPRTETTSLAGGRLMACELSRGGADPNLPFSDKMAEAGGEVYLNPLDLDKPAEKQKELQRQAVVVGGGVVANGQDLMLAINQPSWALSRAIADRINERFAAGLNDHIRTAVAKDDSVVMLNIPLRFADRREEFLNWIGHLYVDGSEDFPGAQARRLTDLLVSDPRKYGPDVTAALIALNKTVLPTVRGLYDHPVLEVRLAVLEVGAVLEDAQATDALVALCSNPETRLRARAAELLVNLPASLRASDALQKLLSDAEPSVRLTAYSSLASIVGRLARDSQLPGTAGPIFNLQAMSRMMVTDGENFKFALDVVRSDKPTIFIRQADVPYLVIFGPNTSFKRPLVAMLWDNHLMLRADQAGDLLSVFYQPPGRLDGVTAQIAPAVATFAWLLGRRPGHDTPGMNLSYSQVINAVYALYKAGYIDANIQVQESNLVKMIADMQKAVPPMRPIEYPAATQPATTEPAPLELGPTRVSDGR